MLQKLTIYINITTGKVRWNVLDIFWIYGVTKFSSWKIIAGCEGVVINKIALLDFCRHAGFTSEIYGHLSYISPDTS